MSCDMNNLLEKTLTKEKELNDLLEKLKSLQRGDFESANSTEAVKNLLNKNKKLKYRLGILKTAIEEQKAMSKKRKSCNYDLDNSPFGSLLDILTSICSAGLEAAFPEVDVVSPVTLAGNPKFGDYQYNAGLQVFKILKEKGTQVKSAAEVAKKIVEHISDSPLIEKIEVVPAGFINMWLKKEFCQKVITKRILNGIQPPPMEKRLKVVVDFSAPNIAKEMHVGHLRSTIIGDSICRLLEFLGHNVLRLNHVGDWGTQFGMLIAHLQDEFPNYLTVSPPIHDLQTFYKQSKVRFDNDSTFKQRAYECVVKLQRGDEDYIKAWNLICDVSRKEFQQIYDRLDIKLVERGESFYQSRMVDIVDYLDKKGLLEVDDGRKVMFGLEKGQIPMTVVKSDGGFTYDTSDLACLRQRIEEEKAEWIVYVTDAGQANHFKVLFSCAQRARFYDPSKIRVDHVMFGLVLGEDKKKFKTRSGDTIRLVDLLDEGIQRAEAALKTRSREDVLTDEEFNEAKRAVAYGCVKYADLSKSMVNDYVFSFDKMLEEKGNTAIYLLYALTRIRSIARTAGVTPEELKKAAESGELVAAEHAKEWKLVKVLLKFNDVLIKVTQDLLLHSLCDYLYEISTTFTEFYNTCYCVEKEASGEIKKIHMNRLLLCEATALTMEKCFSLLGIKTLHKM